jgi:hypothetical protein
MHLGDPWSKWEYAKVVVKTGEATGLVGWAAMRRDDGGRMFEPSASCTHELNMESQQMAMHFSSPEKYAQLSSRPALSLVPFYCTMSTFFAFMLLNYVVHTAYSGNSGYAAVRDGEKIVLGYPIEYTEPLKELERPLVSL